MELTLPEVKLDKGTVTKTSKFYIGNTAIMLGIVRSKMYSNKIKTVVQEYSSNARDAHREVGKETTPIQITLPNKFEPTIKIQDFGPGITPDRMENVFLAYGNSTKRDSNKQTGGFGLGAKSGFSLSDSFTIVTVTDELGYNVKRTYIAIIDSTQEGEMNLVGEEDTNDPTGTTIILACNEDQFTKFEECLRDVASFWDVKPIVTGIPNFEWHKFEVDLAGSNWKVHFKQYYGGYGTKHWAILDGIPYPIERQDEYTEHFDRLGKWEIHLLFKSCELDVTANREGLDYNPKTIEKIKNVYDNCLVEIEASVQKEIEKCETYFEAAIKHEKCKENFKLDLENVTWKGHKLETSFDLNAYVHQFSMKDVYSRRSRSENKKLCNYDCNGINLKEQVAIVINDEMHLNENRGTAPRNKMITLINLGYKNIYVINSYLEPVAENKAKAQLILDLIPEKLIKLSTVVKTKRPRSPNGSSVSNPVCYVKRYNQSGYNYNYNSYWSGTNLTLNDKEKRVYVEIDFKSPQVNGREVNGYTIEKLRTALGLKELYGISIKHKDKIKGGWVKIDDAIVAALEKYASSSACKDTSEWALENVYNEMLCKIIRSGNLDKDGIAYKYLKASDKAVKIDSIIAHNIASLRPYCSKTIDITLKEDSLNLESLSKEFAKKYPLIIDFKEQTDRKIKADVVWYIQQKDKEI